MTNKEAIEVLQASSIKQMSLTKIIVDEKSLSVKVALEMAIKALEQEPILDKIRAEIAEIPKKYPMTMDYENGLKEALGIIDKYKAESEVDNA